MIRSLSAISALVFGAGAIIAQEGKPATETRVYELKKDLLNETSPLAESGVPFPKGTSAEYDSESGLLTVVHFEPRFAEIELFLDLLFEAVEPLRRQEPLLHIIHERIEVDHLDFSNWLLENTMSNDGTALRREIQRWARAGKATIVDTTTLSCRSGQRAKTSSGEEYIYPTEPGVPEIPNQLELSGAQTAPIVPRVASAFETRNLGVSLEVDPVLGFDEITIDLNLAPEAVDLPYLNHIQAEPEGNVSAIDMPNFLTQRITTQVTLLNGRYVLLGTTEPSEASHPDRKNPLVLNFVRADVGAVAGWSRVK